MLDITQWFSNLFHCAVPKVFSLMVAASDLNFAAFICTVGESSNCLWRVLYLVLGTDTVKALLELR
jgi:hypothetical protein